MPKSIFCFLFFVCSISQTFTQSFEEHIHTSLKKDPTIDFRLDSRNSFITERNVRIAGVKVGLDYNNTLRYGIGFNLLRSELKKEIVVGENLVEAQLRYFSVSPYIEYTFYRDERWEITIPVQFGFGNSYYRYIINKSNKTTHQQFVVSYEPAITAQYRVLKYFGLNAGIGYRLMIKGNSQIDESFTAPVYMYGLKLFIEDLYKDIFKKEN